MKSVAEIMGASGGGAGGGDLVRGLGGGRERAWEGARGLGIGPGAWDGVQELGGSGEAQ